MNVLVVNSGSSSLKFQVISTDLERIKQYKDDRLCRGRSRASAAKPSFSFTVERGQSQKFTASLRDISAALDYLVRYIASEQSGVPEIKSTADMSCRGTPRGAWR